MNILIQKPKLLIISDIGLNICRTVQQSSNLTRQNIKNVGMITNFCKNDKIYKYF